MKTYPHQRILLRSKRSNDPRVLRRMALPMIGLAAPITFFAFVIMPSLAHAMIVRLTHNL